MGLLAPDMRFFLGSLDVELRRTLAGAGALEEAARPLVLAAQSKRARPMVAWLVGRALGVRSATVLDVAVAVELVHAASLLHDDVIDGATERRGLPSANVTWGSTLAVLSGDLLLTTALSRLHHLGAAAIERAIEVVAEMTRAVADEVAARRDVDVSLARWRTMAEGKTGALFGLAASMVARAAGDEGRAERCDRALRHLGVAFQIADDLGDLEPGGGETPFQDLRDGAPSFPVLAVARRAPAVRAALAAAWGGDDVSRPSPRELAELVLAAGARELAEEQIAEEIAAARALLEPERAAFEEIEAILAWAERLVAATGARYPRAPEPARAAAPAGG